MFLYEAQGLSNVDGEVHGGIVLEINHTPIHNFATVFHIDLRLELWQLVRVRSPAIDNFPYHMIDPLLNYPYHLLYY
jgi:hypothetical protein